MENLSVSPAFLEARSDFRVLAPEKFGIYFLLFSGICWIFVLKDPREPAG